MPKTFNDLTPDQQAAFWADVKRWGLEESDVPAESNTGLLGSNASISSLPDSNVQTKPFTLTSVEHMKEMVGIPDELFASGKMRDRMVSYPEDLPADRMQLVGQAPNYCALKDSLTEAEHDVVTQAWLAYLVGDSRKISPGMVSLINAVHFPAIVAVAAVQNITVAANTVYTFGSPGAAMQVIPIGILTIEEGGSIAFASPCTLQCQSTSAAAGSSMATVASAESVLTDPSVTNINIYSPAPAPPATPAPQSPKGQENNATPGQTGSSGGKNPTTICATPSGAATNGDTGYNGTPGSNGQGGISPPPVISYLGVVTGTYNFMAGGGNAQNGGKGGDAGQGGQGGNGASGAGGKCANQPPGKGGMGGTGGPGGTPGDGANGSTSYFYYTSSVQPFTWNVTPVGGYGGQPGLGGGFGAAGSGGSDPAGVMGGGYVAANYNLGPGTNGATGNNGNPGKNANAGFIYFQLKPA